MLPVQSSLFDLAESPRPVAFDPQVERTTLASGAWVEHHPSWLAGDAVLFEQLASAVPWKAERRRMYDRVVDVPRLVCFYGEGEHLPHPALGESMDALSDRYEPDLGEPFRTVGLCRYRDGRDSVAWHGDTIGRSSREDTIVAILSIGAPRGFLLRPAGGGPSLRFELGHGDLFVMGGSCQRSWQHAVPKTSRAVGERISVQFRTRGVR